jgi:hypothetical protein
MGETAYEVVLLREYARDLAEHIGTDFPCAKVDPIERSDNHQYICITFPNFNIRIVVAQQDQELSDPLRRLGSGRISKWSLGDIVCGVHPNTSNLSDRQYLIVGNISDPSIYDRVYDFIAARVMGV